VFVEDKTNGSAVISHLRENLSGVIAVNPEGGKVSRMMAAAPEFQAHNSFFDRTGAWTNKAIDQLCNFPNARNDDISDAISQASIWLQNNSYSLGLVDFFKQVATGAKKLVKSVARVLSRAPGVAVEAQPPVVDEDEWRSWANKLTAPPCPHPLCKATCTMLIPGVGGSAIRCNQCGRVNGQDAPKPAGACCGNYLPQIIPGGVRCGNCGAQSGGAPSCQSSSYLPRPVAEIVYTYRINGGFCGGVDEKPFFFECSAKHYAEQFAQGDSLFVLVKPGEPEVSIVLDEGHVRPNQPAAKS
jgi:hypothetical protein